MAGLFSFSIPQLKEHYLASKLPFKKLLYRTIEELSIGLTIDLSLLDKELDDPVLLSLESFGVLEGLKRALQPLAETINAKTISYHHDWSILAGRAEIQRLKLMIPESFVIMISKGEEKNMWHPDYLSFVKAHLSELESMMDPAADYQFSFFGVRTLEKSYLVKVDGETVELPSQMYLRVATFLKMTNTKKRTRTKNFSEIENYFQWLIKGYFTHASPTLFNAGLKKGSLASCFLLSMSDDLEGIFDCLKHCALISKATGGIGLDVSNIRHSQINYGGSSSGIVPMLQVYNMAMRYVDQGGRRKGSATIFLQPWHIDFYDFLCLKRQHGKEELRARDLFYAVWNCDLFMMRVKNDGVWSLFCPKKCKLLTETFGEEFEKNYTQYEHLNMFEKQVPARELWNELLTTQIETGMPFLAYKDTANYTSNQSNLGLIRSSNLCMEIVEVTNTQQISSCNLASLSLDEFVQDGVFDFALLGKITREVVIGLNAVIDRTEYPLGKEGIIAETNMKYRPLGIGVQGLAETFFKLKLAWSDAEAQVLNEQIFATIYYHAVLESVHQAELYGSYTGFEGSPASKGILKIDLVSQNRKRLAKMNGSDEVDTPISDLYNWDHLRHQIKKGMRNSLLIALMPTASTAQIRGKTESFEPMVANLYTRSVLSGSFPVLNKYLMQDLIRLKMWNKSISQFIMRHEGSIQELPNELSPEIPRLKEIYRTAFELRQRILIDMAIDRSKYICQSQSLNIFIGDPTHDMLTSMHFYAWTGGLTTGMYYLRTTASTEAVKFTLDADDEAGLGKKLKICTDEVCISCSS